MPGTPKTGGRQKGTPNKRTQEVGERLAALGCDPIEGMVLIGLGKLECTACAGKGKLRYRRFERKLVFDPEGTLMACLQCFGTGFEHVDISTRARVFGELAQYLYPKRKAIEVRPEETQRKPGHYTLEELLTTYRSLGADDT